MTREITYCTGIVGVWITLVNIHKHILTWSRKFMIDWPSLLIHATCTEAIHIPAFGNIAFGPDGNSLYFSAYIYLIDQKKALGNVKNQRQRKPRNS